MSDTIWIKLQEQERSTYKADGSGGYERIPLPSIVVMSAKATRSRKWRGYWRCKEGWIVEKRSEEQMIADGYRKVPRSFSGEVLIRADLGDERVIVQLPEEYGGAVVRMYGKTLAIAVCEGLVVGDRIRGPFRLVELGGTMTLTLRS